MTMKMAILKVTREPHFLIFFVFYDYGRELFFLFPFFCYCLMPLCRVLCAVEEYRAGEPVSLD